MVTRIILFFNDIGFFEDYSVVVDLHCIELAQPREMIPIPVDGIKESGPIVVLKDSVVAIDEWLLIERWACVLPKVTMSQSVGSRSTMFLVRKCRVGGDAG